MKKIISFLLILASLFSLASCSQILGIADAESDKNPSTNQESPTEEETKNDENKNESSTTEEDESNPIIVQKYSIQDVYKTMPQLHQDTPIESFTDYEKNYFFFKLGEISRVPIAYSSSVFYQGLGTRILKFSTVESVENIISSAVEDCFSTTISAGINAGIGIGTGVENDGNANLAGALLQAELSASLSASTSTTLTKTISDTFSKCKEDVFELDPSCPEGFYRYTVYANCEIFVAIEADPKTKTFEYTYLCFVKNDTKIEGWIYSQNGYYETEETISQSMEKLSISEEMLKNIDIYGEVNKVKCFKGTSIPFSANNILDEDYELYFSPDLKTTQLDFDFINKIGLTKAIIELSYDVYTPQGECQSRCLITINENTVYKGDWLHVSESKKTYTAKCEVSISQLAAADYNFKIAFRCLSDGPFDLLYNSYYIKNGTINITFK